MERKEVDGFPSLFYNTLNATHPNWRTEKNVKLILQYGLEKEPELPNVPSALEYRDVLITLDRDVRGHLMLAAGVLADLRPKRRAPDASKQTLK